MCLFDITGGFYSIRTSLERTIGPAASTLLYQAGVEGGKRFVSSASKIGIIRSGPVGLEDCIEIFSQAGFGSFQITESDWRDCHIVVECEAPSAFEAFAFKENKSARKEPVCDYARGVLAGFCQQLSAREDVMCVEVECMAAGSRRCLFEIGGHAQLKGKALAGGVKI